MRFRLFGPICGDQYDRYNERGGGAYEGGVGTRQGQQRYYQQRGAAQEQDVGGVALGAVLGFVARHGIPRPRAGEWVALQLRQLVTHGDKRQGDDGGAQLQDEAIPYSR